MHTTHTHIHAHTHTRVCARARAHTRRGATTHCNRTTHPLHLAGAALSIVVDAPGPLRTLAAAAAARGAVVRVLVEVEVGQERCGVDGPDAAASLAAQIAELGAAHGGAVVFGGIQAYHGGIQHVRDPARRAAAAGRAAARAAEAVAAVRERTGLPVAVITGGGSGTYRCDAGRGVYTEVQPGMMLCRLLTF